MSSEVEGLWREFEAETDEHLETLERLLTVSQGTGRGAEEIGAIFRAFHSLKGAFAVMGLPNAETVAHRSEDILSLVREGHASLGDELTKLLLDAVDRLKKIRDVVVTKRTDAPPARQLIGRLEAYRDRILPSPEEVQARDGPRPAALGSDGEMLAIFGELLEQRLPDVGQIFSSDAQRHKDAAEAAAELANAAEVLGFDALAEGLKRIAAARSGIEAGDRADPVHQLNDVRVQISLVAEATGMPCGLRELGATLKSELVTDYRAALSRLSDALAGNNDFADVLANAAAARALANSIGFEHSVELLLLLEEQQGRLATGELSPSSAFGEVAHQLLSVLSEAAALGQDVEPGAAATLSRLWHDVLGTEPLSQPGQVGAGSMVLRPEFRATMSGEQTARIEQAIASGKRAFEILLDLESDPEVSANILSWLTSAVETVTSRTVFREGKSYFEFLVLSAQAGDWLQAQLKELDPERICVEEIREAAAEEAEASMPAPAARASARASAYVRVRSDVIDRLMGEVGEMRTVLAALSEAVQNGHGVKAIGSLRLGLDQLSLAIPAELQTRLETVERAFGGLASLETKLEAAHRRIWEAGLQLRVVPVDALFTRLVRAARDLAERLGRPVEVRIEGADVRIDKRVVDHLMDALMHMVRNAIDHGIEPPEQRAAAGKPARALIRITAIERSNKVDLIIADDGRGLDKARIVARGLELGLLSADEAEHISQDQLCRLLLRPGFSTAQTVTELSGRGVGMDVVGTAVQKLGGSIHVDTAQGVGTSFTLTIPLSASLLRCLLVCVEDHTFAIPERQILRVAEIEAGEIETIGENRFCAHGDLMIPVHALGRLLGLAVSGRGVGRARLIIVSTQTQSVALEVDRILRFQDLFLKELHPILAEVPAISGASVLGDGRPVLVLDVDGLTSVSVPQTGALASRPALQA